MSLTITDISDKLLQINEVLLLEVLEITSEDIVERFQDKILIKADYLEEDLL